MREVKFRAWSKKTEKLLPVFYEWRIPEGHICYAPLPVNYKADDFELMQYTGLKDKNGVEIYEGDIIHWPAGIYATNEEVKWDFKRLATLREAADKIYIIGNIYENPELLKGYTHA